MTDRAGIGESAGRQFRGAVGMMGGQMLHWGRRHPPEPGRGPGKCRAPGVMPGAPLAGRAAGYLAGVEGETP